MLRFDASFWKESVDVDLDTEMFLFDLNFPAPWSDRLFTAISHDLFFNIGGGSASATVQKFAGGFEELVRHRFTIVTVGTTLYLSTRPGVRPFLQLGYGYSSSELQIVLEDDSSKVVNEVSLADADEHGFVVNPGIEIDLREFATFRSQINLDTSSLDTSEWQAYLLFAPGERWTFNIGGFGLLDGYATGIRFGVGWRF